MESHLKISVNPKEYRKRRKRRTKSRWDKYKTNSSIPNKAINTLNVNILRTTFKTEIAKLDNIARHNYMLFPENLL